MNAPSAIPSGNPLIQNPTALRLTPASTGAVATILYSGSARLLEAHRPHQGFMPRNGRPMELQPCNHIVFGRWGIDPGEEVVLCRLSDSEFEIHCHGGLAAVQRILNDLATAGCRILDSNEIPKNTQGVFEHEWEQALMRASTEYTAHLLLAQRQIIPECLKTLWNDALSACLEKRLSILNQLISHAQYGRKLTEPWQVVLTGRPNVGKSSLMNALLGFQRSVVYDQPGTTRDVVTGMTAMSGWPIHLSDTAGLRETEESIEQEGVRRAHMARARADLVLHVLDLSEGLSEDELAMVRQMPESLLVVNKGDLTPAWDVTCLPRTSITVSASRGMGLEELMTRVVSRLIPDSLDENAPLLFTDRQVRCAETARLALIDRNENAFVDACRNLCEVD